MMERNKAGLLSFDFDGTLYSSLARPHVDHKCIAKIRDLTESGYLWGINTGRSFDHLLEGIVQTAFFEMPHFIVARERDIYFLNRNTREYEVDREWNEYRDYSHDVLFSQYDENLREIMRYVEFETQAQWISEQGDEAGLIATSVEEMDNLLVYVDSVGKLWQVHFLRQTNTHLPDLIF